MRSFAVYIFIPLRNCSDRDARGLDPYLTSLRETGKTYKIQQLHCRCLDNRLFDGSGILSDLKWRGGGGGAGATHTGEELGELQHPIFKVKNA